ncbi:hypothetical protein FGB62_234g08 [Gracilaria domingensis]|nr:hypothetical protein FGB62_234g08 [Gracilaria domingensis]
MGSCSTRSTALRSSLQLILLLPLVHAVSLTQYNTCADLVNYFKTNALSRVGAYGLGDSRNYGGFRPSLHCGPSPPYFEGDLILGGDFGFGGVGSVGGFVGGEYGYAVGGNGGLGGDGLIVDDAPVGVTASEPAPAGRQPEAGVDFSETNVQVEGVDEPDIIKTDGRYVFVIRGTKLFVLKVENGGKNGWVTGELTLPSHAREMLIEGNHLLVLAQTYGSIYSSVRSDTTSVYQIKVTNGVPRLLATLRMQGRYLNSREVNGVARIVMLYKPQFRFRYPSCLLPYGEAATHNEQIIQNSTQNDWYPSYRLNIEGQNDEITDLISTCSNVFSPPSFPGFELLSVVTLPVSGNLRPTGSVSIVSEGDEVYATASSLYVTTTDYRWDFFGFESSIRSGRNFKTSIHKFSLSNRGAAYVASGDVTGSVLNQFSMHEYNNHFFIATTEGARWWGSRDESSSKVTSFATASNRRLQKVGEAGNLGLGERIYAVRYVKDTAYVVTFRQIDPLYIIDLSNPRSLRATGELKIPGYSAYLHPIVPGRILGVGQDATPEGRVTGSKVTLFDVSDKTNPLELSSWTMPNGHSSAEWDHRAFLYWAPESVAVLPVSTHFWGNEFVGSVVLEISESTIRERGRITHGPASAFYTPSIERNLVIGGEHLWSLSSEQIQVNNIRDLSKESATTLQVSHPPPWWWGVDLGNGGNGGLIGDPFM